MQYHNPVSLLVVSSKGWKHHSIETSYSNTGVTTFSFCDTPLLKLSIFFAWQFCCHVPRIFPALWDYYWPWFLKLHTRQLIAIGDPRVFFGVPTNERTGNRPPCSNDWPPCVTRFFLRKIQNLPFTSHWHSGTCCWEVSKSVNKRQVGLYWYKHIAQFF